MSYLFDYSTQYKSYKWFDNRTKARTSFKGIKMDVSQSHKMELREPGKIVQNFTTLQPLCN